MDTCNSTVGHRRNYLNHVGLSVALTLLVGWLTAHKKPVPKVLLQNRWRMRSKGNRPAQIHAENSHWNRWWLFARAVDGGYGWCCNLHFTHTHAHFMALFQGLFGWAIARRKLFWSLWCKRRYQEADTPTIRLGATPSGLIGDPSPSSLHFYAGSPSCRNPPNLSWLATGTKYAGLHTQWLGFVTDING